MSNHIHRVSACIVSDKELTANGMLRVVFVVSVGQTVVRT